MSMQDFAAALQGGAPTDGPGPPDPNAPVDPTLGPPPDDGSQPGGPPDGQGGELFDNSMEALDVAEEALHAFIRLDPDEADRAAAGSLLTGVLKLKASNQKSVQSGDMKSLSRALSGGASIAQAAPAGG
jgi:hypothetical protein